MIKHDKILTMSQQLRCAHLSIDCLIESQLRLGVVFRYPTIDL